MSATSSPPCRDEAAADELHGQVVLVGELLGRVDEILLDLDAARVELDLGREHGHDAEAAPPLAEEPAGREVALGDRREDAVDGVEVAGHEPDDGVVEPPLDERLEPALRLPDELPHPVGHPDRDLPEFDVHKGMDAS